MLAITISPVQWRPSLAIASHFDSFDDKISRILFLLSTNKLKFNATNNQDQ